VPLPYRAFAGLFVLSLRNATGTRIGLDPDRVLLAQVDLVSAGMDSGRQDAYWQAVVERMHAAPHVVSAALSIGTPFRSSMAGPFLIPGRDSLPRVKSGGPYRYGVGPGFFSTIGARVLRGCQRRFESGQNLEWSDPARLASSRLTI
jgi:hypothetical protein